MLKPLTRWARRNVGKAVLSASAFSALVSVAATDFAGYRAANREIMKRQLEVIEQTDQQLADLLRRFADRATGKGIASSDDLKALREQVGKSFSAAERLADRFPEAKPEFDAYADALVRLQKTAEKFEGPIDAKPFVEAVGGYFSSKRKFDQRLSAVRMNWP